MDNSFKVDEGFDIIYEVVMEDNTTWWVDFAGYKRISIAMGDRKFVYEDDKIIAILPDLIEFTTLDGFEVTTTTDKITYLTKSTRAVRDANRERNKTYRETELNTNKQEWEE